MRGAIVGLIMSAGARDIRGCVTRDWAWRLYLPRSTATRVSRSGRVALALTVNILFSILFGVLSCGFFAARADDVLTFTLQGIKRTATLYRPAELQDGPAPVLIALHGRGQTVESFREWLHFETAADREQFLVAYPEAVETDWSYGRPILKPMPAVNGEIVDDVAFIRRLIDELTISKQVNPARIYVAGISRGGLMAYTIACALADRVAAVAAVISPMTEYQRQDCRPAKPVPLMVVAGTHDRLQPYDGWLAPAGRLLSVPETMEYWRAQNGCRNQRWVDIPHLEPSDPTRIWLLQWTDCESGKSLRLYRVNGGGHQAPSLAPSSQEEIKKFGLRNRDVESADEIWSFVKDYSR
jgi:polyhydroxybutyrate depolymerase